MNILILGGGGREHALAWACAQNPKADRIIVAPGNAGVDAVAECARLDPCDADSVLALCADRAVDLVIVGPEAPLVAGIADALSEAGIAVLGPSAEAARLESSKAFTKEICAAAGAPTAAARAFEALDEALAHLREVGAPIVVKADGLAAGKGVVVAEDLEEAEEALRARLRAPGDRVVIEEVLRGTEASLFVLCDGEKALAVGTAQDHKRAHEGDAGPMTGGMGAFSPAPVLTPEVEARAMDEIVRPVLRDMARRGTPYRGVLYAGLMVEDGAPRLVEFNCRFGDPETQVLAMRLGGQMLDLVHACAEGRLDAMRPRWAEDHALTVVIAAEGYPGEHARGEEIRGLDDLPEGADRMTFHAGTAREDGRTVSAGGRVLCATGRGATRAEARARAYALAEAVDWPGGRYRRDIGGAPAGRDVGGTE